MKTMESSKFMKLPDLMEVNAKVVISEIYGNGCNDDIWWNVEIVEIYGICGIGEIVVKLIKK